MINIAVGGAKGRVGQCVVKAVEADSTTHLSAAIVREDLQENRGLQAIQDPIDVFIDFTKPEAAIQHLHICSERGIRMVIGVTGFTEAEKNQIKEKSKKIPIVCAPNMSIGINLSFKLLALAAQTLKDSADIAILDFHHKHKKDAPSGTALKMREIIAKAKETTLEQSGVSFSSLRMGEKMGVHTALFALAGEELEITHQTFDRSVYAKGALLAAKWLMNKAPGLYDMQDVLGLKS